MGHSKSFFHIQPICITFAITNFNELKPVFDHQSVNLPIVEVIPEIKEKLQDNNTLILSAPPGAGKSTLLPLALMEEVWLQGQKIVMLEPRRLAARTIAMRMSDLLNQPVGDKVGYRVRFESKISANTQVEILTEGILTRMLQQDNSLEGIGMIIFDEFHERSLFAEVALALCREAQQILRPDLRIVIMSATLDIPQLASLLNAPVVASPGRQYPIDIRYGSGCDERMIPELCAATICSAVKEEDGDLLAFLPGEGEIRRCEELLRKQLPHFRIHPLFGSLPPNKQYAAIMPDRDGRRKIVLATSIAETSLTIEGIRIVVDSGFTRTSRFNPNNALSRLETVMVSKDMADQRAGRAGRLGAGVCFRLWSKATHERLAEHRTPEIEEADLASLTLDMAVWGVQDIAGMTWLTPPPKGHLGQATELLHELEALENGKITRYGHQMHKLPCHPRIAHMLICAKEMEQLPLATDIAAILEERDPLPKDSGIDINLRIEALRRHRDRRGDAPLFARIEKIAASYRQLFGIIPDNGAVDPYTTGYLLVHAYPERIASATPGNNAQFRLANGSMATAGRTDDLAYESWLAVAQMDARDGLGRIFMASPINPQDLLPLVKERDVISWDSKKGGLIAQSEMRIGNLLLKSKPLANIPSGQRITAICEAIGKEGEQLLDFNEEVTQWQNRVLSLRKWRKEEWPDVSTTALLSTCKEWLAPYLENISKAEELKRIRLTEVLLFHLDYTLQQQLDLFAPARIEVPSGSQIKLEYFPDGAQPILAVRLQEMFGLPETPRINEGSVPVLLHLLSPGFKPVQVTSDLSSFWNNAYFEVKKELQRRYPKHVWPDNPWTEEAVRGVKRRNT
ncbi:MAG: ATP-dependent helicase HrpB [Bacteroidales bacterium]